MGCCVSANNTSPPLRTPHVSDFRSSAAEQNENGKSPPPTHPLPEEETVKEVLSETPSIPRTALGDFSRTADDKHRHQNGGVFKKLFVASSGKGEQSEEASEICSTVSENASVSTSVTEKKEDHGVIDDEFCEQIMRRSPERFESGSFSGEVTKREKAGGKSPGRRSDPSPDRIRPGSGYGKRRDASGQSSGRRSRSPVIDSDSGSWKPDPGRSQSTRKTGKNSGSGEKEKADKRTPTGNELLDTSLMSLECFIFL